MKTYSLLMALLLAMSATVQGAEAPAKDYKHLGVATCSSSVCHGKISAQADRRVALNEYTVWTQDDRHSQAYNRLKSPAALQIAAKLGLPNAAGAKICLDCHSDSGAQGNAGLKFKLADGVACEACHGGAEKWVETHTQASATHQDNIARGMYPTEQPLRRAALCLSCHLGARDKFATHAIMGAGHPRLSFELEAFTANEPAHYVVDADYVARKGRIDGMDLWAAGQLEAAERYLTLLQTNWLTPSGIITPELAFYDCFGCHHATDNLRWTRNRAGPGVNPGGLRLQKQHLLMVEAMSETLAPNNLADLTAGTDALIRAGQSDAAAVRAAAQKLLDRLRACEPWAVRAYTPAEITKVRKTLVRFAAEDKAGDFAVAEQVVLGVESMSYSLNDRERRKAALDALYDKVKSGANFNAAQFADAARRVQAQF